MSETAKGLENFQNQKTEFSSEISNLIKYINATSIYSRDAQLSFYQCRQVFFRHFYFQETGLLDYIESHNPLYLAASILAIRMVSQIQGFPLHADLSNRKRTKLNDAELLGHLWLTDTNLNDFFERNKDHPKLKEPGFLGAIGMIGENDSAWGEFYNSILTHRNGFIPRELYDNTYRLGPFYNKIAENGLPLLGETAPAIWTGYGPHKQEPIGAGKAEFLGLTASSDGKLDLMFGAYEDRPAMIFDEDIEVLLATTFGMKTSLWPSIDLQPVEHEGKPILCLNEKEIKPDWISNTLLADTMYATDTLLSNFFLSFDRLEVSKKSPQIVKDTIKKFKAAFENFTTDNPPNTLAQCFQINPVFADMSCKTITHADGKHTTWVMLPPQITMRIEGGFVTGDGNQNIHYWQHRNDPRYRTGQISNYLTENFDDVATLIPAYERLRQIMSIKYAFNDLKSRGFAPNAEMQEYIDQVTMHLGFSNYGCKPVYVQQLRVNPYG